jgi:tetratricopeptide (TPR) repeat protein
MRARALLALFLLGLAAAGCRKDPPPPLRAPSSRVRPTVAVINFFAPAPDERWLSTAASELLAADLATEKKIRVIPPETVARTILELKLPQRPDYDPATLARVRRNLGCDYVVTGSCDVTRAEDGSRIVVTATLVDTLTGERLAWPRESGWEKDLADIMGAAGETIRKRLVAGERSKAVMEMTRSFVPRTAAAAHAYADGIRALRNDDAQTARTFLESAVEQDPSFPLAHAALANALSSLGYDEKATAEAKTAFSLSEQLPWELRLSIDGGYRKIIRDWPAASTIYGTLFSHFPDDLEYGLQLAEVQAAGGKGKECLDTVARLRRLSKPAGDDPRIDLAEAAAWRVLGDYPHLLAAARAGAASALAHGAPLLTAQARSLEGMALARLGQQEEAEKALLDARSIYQAAENLSGTGRTELRLGSLHVSRGQGRAALDSFQSSLSTGRKIGDKWLESASLANISFVLLQQGNLDDANGLLQQALDVFRQIADRQGQATALDSLGYVQYLEGRLDDASKTLSQSLAIGREIGNISITGQALHNLAEVTLARGDIERARFLEEESLKLRISSGDRRGIADSRVGLSEIALAAGEARHILAGLSADHDAAQAARSLEVEAHCEAVASEAWLLMRQTRQASAAAARATALASPSFTLATRLRIATAGGRVAGATGNVARAREVLERVIADAAGKGLLEAQYKANLALGEIELRSGSRSAGRARLQAIAAEAGAKGFTLIARRAASLSRG